MRNPMPWCLVFLLLGCSAQDGAVSPASKSMFALTADDFDEHDPLDVTDPAMTPMGGPFAPLMLTQGELVLIQASRTVTDPGGTSYGPNGDPAGSNGGTPFLFPNRSLNALFGTIGEDVFLVGDSLALLAPAGGPLRFRINTCAPGAGGGMFNVAQWCPLSGAFHVKVHRKPHVTIADKPPVTDNTIMGTVAVDVDAGAGWSGTGIHLDKGQKVFVHARGSFVAGGKTFGADGDPSGSDGGTPYLLSNHFAYRLYARVADQVVDAGADTSFLSPAAGELQFAVNQRGDAAGTLHAEVGLGVVPARGLINADTRKFTQHQTLEVPLDAAWHATSLHVQKGDPILASATGELSGNSYTGGPVDPFGSSWWGGDPWVLVNRFVWGLYGRVGGEVFYLGGQQALLAPASGTVELVINADAQCPRAADPAWCTSGHFTATLMAP